MALPVHAGRRPGFPLGLALLPALLAGPIRADRLTSWPLFEAKTDHAAARAWTPCAGVPPVSAGPAGTRFRVTFGPGLDRAYWDRAAPLDLSPYDQLELDVTCPRPDAIRTLGLYLRSGDGWYLWLASSLQAGRNTLVFPVRDAGEEGRAAGWDAIRAVRLSLTCRGNAASDAEVTVHRLAARQCDLVLVQGSASLKSAAEQAFARTVTQRLSRWLNEAGMAHALTDDEAVAGGRLTAARIAVLPYNSFPPERMLRAIERFVRRGGKLVVCYSAEPSLAALMGLKLGPYQAQKAPGQWSGFAFQPGGPPGLPPVVYQESSNILPAFPASEQARVIAFWQDSAGRVSSDPAWLQTPQGFWMTHVLLDGDPAGKRRMLAALLGVLKPALWADTARRADSRAGQIGPFRSLEEASAAIARQARGAPDEARVTALLAAARREAGALADALAGNRPTEAPEIEHRLNAALTEAYARIQRPRAPEFRGVWDHAGTGLYPGDWPATCRILSAAGLTAIFPNLLWAGAAHYPGHVLPSTAIAEAHGDQLAQCTAAAHRAGLEVHVWKVCWNLSQAPASFVQTMRKAGRLQRTDGGQELDWLCPSHPDNRALELESIAEMASRARVDGLHLDYVRYPDGHACFCPGCRRRFSQAEGGAPLHDWPACVQTGPWAARFQAWRRDQITAFVRAARDTVRKAGPRIRLSAAVFPDPAGARTGIGQDWARWLADGLVDFVCPMNYTTDPAVFRGYVQGQLALPGAAGRVYPGLGVTASESQLTADRVIDQVLTAREAGAGGFVLFDLNRTVERDLLPLLRLGLTRPP